jgi:exodeoxyribonuclease V alpha subunit
MIRGIGPVYAKKLLRAFGEKVFDVIEAEPDRLREVLIGTALDLERRYRANYAAAWCSAASLRCAVFRGGAGGRNCASG